MATDAENEDFRYGWKDLIYQRLWHAQQHELQSTSAIRAYVLDLTNARPVENVDPYEEEELNDQLEQIGRVALDRFLDRHNLDHDHASTQSNNDRHGHRNGYDLENLQAHVLPGGVGAHELIHASASSSGISVAYCISAPEKYNKVGSNIVFIDPRLDSTTIAPLPWHMGGRGGGDGNPFFFDLDPGKMIVYPSNAPRHVTVNSYSTDVVYVTFDFTRSSNANVNRHDAMDEPSAACKHHVLFANGTDTLAAAADGERDDEAAVPKQPRDISELYTIRNSSLCNSVEVSLELTEVEDVVRWGTPVGIARLDPAAPKVDQFNRALLQDATSLEKQYELKRGQDAVYQSPNNINLFAVTQQQSTESSDRDFPAMQTLKAVAEAASLKYASVAQDCKVVEGPGLKENACAEHDRRLQHYLKEKSEKPFKVTSSWLNIASKDQLGINQLSHNHLVYRTSVTGVYYVATGYSDLDEDDYGAYGKVRSTAIRLTRAQSLAENMLHPRFITFYPSPGSILLFPSWLHHAADVHQGDEDRVSYAFNAI